MTLGQELAMFNVQNAITPKVGKPELCFMCSPSGLIELYICMKFRKIYRADRVHSRNGYSVQRASTKKVGSQGLNLKSRLTRVTDVVLCTLSYGALHFHNYISNSFQLTERTRVHDRNGYVQ